MYQDIIKTIRFLTVLQIQPEVYKNSQQMQYLSFVKNKAKMWKWRIKNKYNL